MWVVKLRRGRGATMLLEVFACGLDIACFIRTAEGSEIIVPNGTIISNKVTNWTYSDRYRMSKSQSAWLAAWLRNVWSDY